MRIGRYNLDRDVLVVAEIGNNHEGSFDRAAELIGLAAEAGAHAVKFQTFRTEHYISRADAARFARLKRFELSFDQFDRLARIARAEDVLFLSTPFDLESARFLQGIVDAFKISSGDLTFVPLLEEVARSGKPIIMSTGMATMNEIAEAKEAIERVWRRDSRVPCFVPPSVQARDHSGHSMLHARARCVPPPSEGPPDLGQGVGEKPRITSDPMKHGTRNASPEPELALLHCVSSYPVPEDQANLAAIARLREAFGCTVGYSDHTLGIEAAALSVASGARIVEKHFTISKNYSDFRDHQLSADPPEMAALVEQVRRISALMGDGDKQPQPCERGTIASLRRWIVAAADLPAGATLQPANITWVRPAAPTVPATGVPPGQEHLLLGQRLARAVAAGEPITTDLLLEPNRQTVTTHP